MGIDYVVDFGCVPKQVLSTREIITMIKARSRARTALEYARTSGDQRAASDIMFSVITQTPSGSERQELSAQALLESALPLDEHAHHCAGCKANLPDSPFDTAYGCYGHIPYPIPVHAEDWLLSLFPASTSTTAGDFLISALRDFGYDGAYAAGMRKEGIFFEAGHPRVRTWQRAGEPDLELTSDQAFEMIFGVGDVDPTHAAMLCLLLGVLPHDSDPSILQQALDERPRLTALLHGATLPDEPISDSAGIRRFINALRISAALDVPLIVDG